MAKRLGGKIAIVTRASRGIGRAISVALTKEVETLAYRPAKKRRDNTKIGGCPQVNERLFIKGGYFEKCF